MDPMACLNESRESGRGLALALSWVFLLAALVLLLVYFSRGERVREVVQSFTWLKAMLKILIVQGIG